MASSYPIYGSLELNEDFSIAKVIERIKQVSENLLPKANFGAYIVENNGKRHYGLEQAEVLELCHALKGQIKNLVLTLSGSTGGSLRINLYPEKGKDHLVGKYIISSSQEWRNREIREVILGVWVPRERPYQEIMSLVQSVQLHKSKESPPHQPKSEPDVFKGELHYQESSFYVDSQISFQRIWGLLEEVSIIFLNETPFHFRLGTTDGDYFVDLPPSQLSQIFRLERNRIHTLYIDASTQDGQRVDLSLRFHKLPSNPNGLIEVTAYEAEEIIHHIVDVLSRKREISLNHASIFQKKFSFDTASFSIETLLILTNAIAGTYFKGVNATADLYTVSGKSFTQLSINQLKEAFNRNEHDIRKIGIYVAESQGNHFFFLKFNWENRIYPHGEIQMLLGDSERHETVQDLIWEKLGLTPPTYDQESSPDLPQGSLTVRPHFQQRVFSDRGKGCLVVMPMETYWTEPIWGILQHILKRAGFDFADRADSLSQTQDLEENWTKINESEMVLADLTYRQPFVFYWVGVAHTLGKKVLLISQHKRDIPESMVHLPYILYENNTEGLTKLELHLMDALKISEKRN